MAGRLVDARCAAGPSTMAELLAGDAGRASRRWRALAARAAAIPTGSRATGVHSSKSDLLAPVPRPGKVVAIGRNYPDHTSEEGVDAAARAADLRQVPELGRRARRRDPLGSGADRPGRLRGGARASSSGGRRAASPRPRRSTTSSATPASNDVSARDLQFGDGQWVRGKSLDTFCPMGPVARHRRRDPRPADLRIACLVNGERVQERSNVRRCSSAWPRSSATARTPSRSSPATSSPRARRAASASSATRRACSRDGDVVTVEIEGIGSLVNTCRGTSGRLEIVEATDHGAGRAAPRSGSWSRAPSAASAPGPSARSPARVPPSSRSTWRGSAPAADRSCTRRGVRTVDVRRAATSPTSPRWSEALDRPRDHERHPPGGPAGSVLPRRSARWAHASTCSARSTSSRRCSAADRAWRQVVYTGSIGMFDGRRRRSRDRRLEPDATAHPINHYGVYKQANEGTARVYWLENGLSSVGLRPMTVYGPGRDQGHDERPDQGDRRRGARPAVHHQLRRRDAVPVRGRRGATLVAASRSGVEGAHVYNLPGTLADGATSSPRSRRRCPRPTA